ncbi:MAG: apolipoprotein N-acyltransferase [Gammaproteobacteria bacterium]|nr:apolipoprotein N-acyltransferase [Gammaproteobacteria bacterium]
MRRLTELKGWRANLAAVIGGGLLPLSMAPFNLFPLAIISLGALFLLWLPLSPKQAFWRGWWYGLGMFGVGVSWVYVSIHYFGYASVPLAILLTLIWVAFLALLPAIAGFLTLYFLRWYRGNETRYLHLELLLVMPVVWSLVEWVRGWILTGLPWLNPGYSQILTPLGGYAPIFGVYGVNWLVALTAGLLVLLIWRWKERRLPYLAALLAIWVVGAGLRLVEWTEPFGNPIKVSMIQGNIDQAEKWKPGQLQKTLNLYTDLTEQHWDSDLIIWPEAALSTWYHHVQNGYLRGLEQRARETDTEMLIGIPYYDHATKTKYNSVLALGGEGHAFYHKHHLVPFGDYLPLENYLRGLIAFFDLPMSSFSAGPYDQAPLNVLGHNISVSICYEDIFGEEVIRTLPLASFLVNVSNDSWWGDSHGTHQHMQIATMRSLETGRPMLRATNNGITVVVDRWGHVTARLPQFETAVLTTEIQPRRGATPYVRVGNTLVILMMFAVLGALLIWRWRERRTQAA